MNYQEAEAGGIDDVVALLLSFRALVAIRFGAVSHGTGRSPAAQRRHRCRRTVAWIGFLSTRPRVVNLFDDTK
jgi:hypothetical protein